MGADITTAAFLDLVTARRGHFRLESGHHGGLWFDLDPLFADQKRIAPFVEALCVALRRHDVSLVCGPLVGGAFLAQLVAQILGVEFCFTERSGPAPAGGLFATSYRLPEGFVARVSGKRTALVDDVMSAGSSLRATNAELEAHGAVPVVAGALLVLGSAGVDFFSARSVQVEAVFRRDYDLWPPEVCPLCAAGQPVEDPVGYSSASGGA